MSAVARTSWRDRLSIALWASVLLVVFLTPLIVALEARNRFRLPKTLFFQSAMLVVGSIAAGLLLMRVLDGGRLRAHGRSLVLAAAAVAWAAVVSMAALQPELARYAPLAAATHATLFVLVILLARGTFLPLMAVLLPAALNAVFTALQVLRIWSPVPLRHWNRGRFDAIGLLGNSNYVGVYLMIPCLVALAAAIAFRRHRVVFVALFATILGGIFFAQSVTGIVTIFTAMGCVALVVRSRPVKIAVAAVLVLLILSVFAYGPTRDRTFFMFDSVQRGNLLVFSSFRLPAFAVAWDMFRERPLLGVGPGGYEARYMSYKIASDERYPEWILLGNANFGETHNDHLQLLAESGIPGYLLFVLCLAALAWHSFRRDPPESPRAYWARLIAFPAAAGLAVSALAQFPLHLTEVLATAVFVAALAHVWRAETPSRGVAA